MKRKQKIWLLIFIPLLIIIAFVAYYQLLYTSPRVNNGIAMLERTFTQQQHIITGVRFFPGDKLVVTGSVDSTLDIWEISNGKITRQIKHPGAIAYLDLSPDGKFIATGGYDSTSDDKTIKIWNPVTHALLKTMNVAEHVQAVAFGPGDDMLFTGGRDKPLVGEFLQEIFGDSHFNRGVSARLWDVRTGELLQTFAHHENDVLDLAYSHNGQWLATASTDHTVDIWRIVKIGPRR